MFKPRRYLFCGSFVYFLSCVSHAFASIHCCLVVTYWEKAEHLALVGDAYCIFVAFLCLFFVCIVALPPKSTAMVIVGRSVHLITLFPGQA